MQQKHLNTLEYPKILDRLASYTAFSASKNLALALHPSPHISQIMDWQKETTEAAHLLSVKPDLGVGGVRDVRPIVEHCARGLVPSAQEFLYIRQTLVSARELARTITRLAEAHPRLADMAQRIEPCPGVVNAISQVLDDHGDIKDSASPTLARIRREIDITHNRLMEKLNRMLASTSVNQYLQEALITQRGGRYVLPVKSDFKGRVSGVVHDQSASGATIFVEPMATVELNNQWRHLQVQEQDEIRKILADLAEQVSAQSDFIGHTVAALADIDLAFAKAKYADAIDAIEPFLVLPLTQKQGSAPQGVFKLRAARHPLLDPKTVVPINVILADDVHMLVITGPNTGGKTVSLKTVGLLTAMAQSGLRIPAAEGSTVPVFKQIFADIGDEQSIEQSLSTFSGHMTNVVRILHQCDARSLVIFDELGAGTDPIEGSALARAILSQLLRRHVTTFVATHYSELKAYAHTTPGVVNASMEFNVETLTPTYRLRIGLPGASNAFTIAQRLGLPDGIINDARGLVSEDARQVEAMLAEIKAQTEAAHRVRQLAETEQQKIEDVTRQLQEQLKEIDAERRNILNDARADARREIKAARERIRELEEMARATIDEKLATVTTPVPDVMKIETELAELDHLEAAIVPEAEPAPPPQETAPAAKPRGPIRLGDTVYVPQFATTAEVVNLQNSQAEVQLGHFRATVPLKTLELRVRAAVAQAEKSPLPTLSAEVGEVDSPGLELDLRGQVVEEAMFNLDQYLDKAFLASLPSVSIIHGRGSGALRQVVRDELRQHPLVSSYRPGKEGEGGDGVTVVFLAIH